MLSQTELCSLVNMGASVVVDAKKMSALNIRQLLSFAKSKNGMVEIVNASHLSYLEIRLLATIAPLNVKFNFVD